jgi:hypothetical protein
MPEAVLMPACAGTRLMCLAAGSAMPVGSDCHVG